jgi:hypothetical protein
MRLCLNTGLIGRAMLACLAIPSIASAVVHTIDANVTAEVKEFENGTQINSDLAFKDLNESTSTLPLVVRTQLLRSEEAGVSAGVTFSDPRLSVLPDPNEFAIDLAAFSVSPTVSYSSRGFANEIREITFLSSEIGAADGTELEAQSFFFIDGIILLWGEEGTSDLSGTTAQLNLSVQKSQAESADATVLQAGLTLTGQADGTMTLTASGGLIADNVTVLNLTNLVPDLGSVHLVVIPNIAIPYTYATSVGQSFRLNAEVSAQIQDQPGTGASIQLGVPLLELASLVNAVSGGSAGTQLQQILEASLASNPAPLKPLFTADTSSTVRIVDRVGCLPGLGGSCCGAIGAESALLMTLLGLMAAAYSRR